MSSLITEEDDEQFCSSFGRKSSIITEEDDKTILNAFIKHTKESKPPFAIKVTNKEVFDKKVCDCLALFFHKCCLTFISNHCLSYS